MRRGTRLLKARNLLQSAAAAQAERAFAKCETICEMRAECSLDQFSAFVTIFFIFAY